MLTRDGYKVDFFARDPEGDTTLIQVYTDVSEPATYEREVRPRGRGGGIPWGNPLAAHF